MPKNTKNLKKIQTKKHHKLVLFGNKKSQDSPAFEQEWNSKRLKYLPPSLNMKHVYFLGLTI